MSSETTPSPSPLPSARPRPMKPRWQSVVLLCKDCQRRKNGPKKKQAKAIASEIRQVARQAEPRARMASTGCLGLCPKAAVVVAWMGRESGSRIVAIETPEQAAKL